MPIQVLGGLFYFSLEDFFVVEVDLQCLLISTIQQNDSVIYVTYIFF